MRRDEVSVYSVKVVLAAAAALLWALIVVDPGLVVRFSGGLGRSQRWSGSLGQYPYPVRGKKSGAATVRF